MRKKVLKECPSIDYGAVYEPEETLAELCLGIKPEKEILGLILQKDGKVLSTGERPFEHNLDNIPFAKYERFELDKYQQEVTIYSSRGCPHQCTFCPNRIISPIFRRRLPQNIVDEMERRGFNDLF